MHKSHGLVGVLKQSPKHRIAQLIVAPGVRHESSSSAEVAPLQEVKFPPPQAAALKKGTGGRSSFNGTVCTVFGANGFLGRYLCNQLGKIGTQLIVPHRGDPYDIRSLKLAGDLGQVIPLPYYLRNPDSIYRALKYSNVVVNLVGKDNETANFTYDEVHVDGARLLAKIAREAGVKRFLHVSALNCSPNPTPGGVIKGGSKFLKSKYYGELAVKEEFPDATIFRPSDIFGVQDRFLFYFSNYSRRSYMATHLWNKGVGVYKQPVFASDVARGIVNAIYDEASIGKTYDAVGPKRYELLEIVKFINRILRRYEEEGFKIKDLKYNPIMWLRLHFIQQQKYPAGGMCWEKIEREMVTDVTTPGNPRLEDLGVQLSPLEHLAISFIQFRRRYGYYNDEVGEFPAPAWPKCL